MQRWKYVLFKIKLYYQFFLNLFSSLFSHLPRSDWMNKTNFNYKINFKYIPMLNQWLWENFLRSWIHQTSYKLHRFSRIEKSSHPEGTKTFFLYLFYFIIFLQKLYILLAGINKWIKFLKILKSWRRKKND